MRVTPGIDSWRERKTLLGYTEYYTRGAKAFIKWRSALVLLISRSLPDGLSLTGRATLKHRTVPFLPLLSVWTCRSFFLDADRELDFDARTDD